MTLEAYAEERTNFVQAAIRPLGVPLSRSNPYFERFMAACLKAEIQYLAIFFEREGGRIEEHRHPDAIEGRWRLAAQEIIEQNASRVLGISAEKSKSIGRTLTQALEQWKTERRLANKTATPHGVREKEKAIEEFEAHAKIQDIGEITRAHIVSFRDNLAKQKYKSPTINKKVGQITTLLTTAQKAGWVETAISGGVYIEIPAGTNEREPFERSELKTIFAQPVFSENQFSENAKAAGVLEFWLPLISVVSGLISSEIFQIGPDTVGPHPDHPEIICFSVTNAGGRSLKSFARKRYVPVRRELWENGLKEIAEKARREGCKSLWPAVEKARSLSTLSNMYSAFWSEFLRKKAGVADPAKALYSLRHNFRDAIAEAGGADFERDQIMGHSEQGTGRKYGTKRKPRVVNIVRLNELVQQPKWEFLSSIRWPIG